MDIKAYQEAHKRGLLQGKQLSAFTELEKRGALPPTLPPTGTPLDASPRELEGHPGKEALNALPGVAKTAAYFAPGSGEYLDAQETLGAGRKAEQAFIEGRYKDMAKSMGQATLASVGVIPLIGGVKRLSKGTGKILSAILKSDMPLTQKAYAIADAKVDKTFLKTMQKEAADLTDKLKDQGDWQGAMDAASDHQMWREAMEKMEGQAQHSTFRQLAKGQKPVKSGIAMPEGMALDTSVGNLMETRTVRDVGKVVKSMDFPKGGGLGGMRVVQVNQYQKSVKGAENYFQAFNDDISKESVKYLKWVERNRNKSAVHVNNKTGLSLDLSTDCPNRLTGACPHCYVEPGRIDIKKAKKAGLFSGTHGKKIVETPYKNEILGMPGDLVTALNRDGGLRMFSAGDYRDKIDFEDVALMLDHAKTKGLYLKAITKQKALIDDFAKHPNMRINLSTDDLPRVMSNAPTIEEAVKWAGDHKNVKIRSVAFNETQALKHLEDARYDVVTMYHGPTNFITKKTRGIYLNPKSKLYIKDPGKRKMVEDYPWDEQHQMYRTNKMIQIIEEVNPEMVKRAGRDALLKETDTWVNHQPGKGVMKKLDEKYPGRLCCTGKKCPKGATKCGFGVGMATLIAGIYMPEWEVEDDTNSE